jgi:diguanylate cyclase (GGDEF)-like protein/PAS domain S-box-containing protein
MAADYGSIAGVPELAALKILLVEDDPDDVVLFGSLLGRVVPMSDFDHVDNIDDARAKMHGAGYDLCFFDYHLGTDTGLDLLRAIRADGFDRPVIMLTGQGDEAVAVEAMKAGATDYIAKNGATPEILDAAIRHATRLYGESQRRRKIERALRVSEARYRELVNRLPVIVSEMSATGETLFVNDAVTEITGYRPDEVVGQNWWQLLAPDSDPASIADVRERLRADDLAAHEMVMRHKDGYPLTLEWNSTTARNADGRTGNVVCIGMDVTERVRMRDELMWMAVRDELTSLSNRRGFLTLAEQQLKSAAREKKSMLAVFVDLDGLKAINDQLGHAEGDQALKDMAGLMRVTFRDSDVIGRIGGDEFVALVTEGSPFRSDGVIQRLQTSLVTFNAETERPYHLSASIGVARYDPDSPIAIDSLVNRADSIMYENKQRRQRRDVVRRTSAVPAD